MGQALAWRYPSARPALPIRYRKGRLSPRSGGCASRSNPLARGRGLGGPAVRPGCSHEESVPTRRRTSVSRSLMAFTLPSRFGHGLAVCPAASWVAMARMGLSWLRASLAPRARGASRSHGAVRGAGPSGLGPEWPGPKDEARAAGIFARHQSAHQAWSTAAARQWETVLEKRLRTSTPAMMSASPAMAAASRDCPKYTQPISVMRAMPAPDQMA